MRRIFFTQSLSIFLSASLLLAETNTTSEVCTLISSQGFGYTGDSSGKRIYSKEEYTYFCTETTIEKGECKKWEEEVEKLDFSFLQNNNVIFKTEDYSGSMGTLLATIQGYDKMNNLWSGWKGLCQKGMDDGNWDWMSDPYVLGSYAITAYSANSGATDMDVLATSTTKEMINQTTQYAICAARAGLDAAKMVEEYFDEEGCDPIDEICDEESNDDSQIFTLPENDLNDMLTNNPDMEEYIKILSGVGTGTVKVEVVNPGGEDNTDAKAAEEAAQEIKELMLKVRAALMAIQLASCLMSSSATGGQSMGADPTSTQNLLVTGIGMYNPLIGMGIDVAMNVYTSLQEIDTCGSESDANEKGSRHIATLKANNNDLCHFISAKTSGDLLSKRTKYNYCCYDDKITKILVEQAKAQFAKDWQHCTDISLKELQYLNFKACDPIELDNSIDGVKLDAYAVYEDRIKAYQYTHKCIDTREYVKYMTEIFGGDNMMIDTQDIEKSLEDLR